MSEFTAVGPAEAHDGLRPRRPRHSLLETEGVVVSEDATRILNGVNVLMYPTGCSELWEPCSSSSGEGTFRFKNADSTQLTPRFDSFVVYKAVTCSTISVGGGERAQEFFDRAEAVLDATLSAGIERALADGLQGSSNPFFGDGNVQILSGSGVSPSVALSYLEEAIGETCREGMLHFTPAAVAGLQPFPLEGGTRRLLTVNGTPLVSGSGYIGIGATGGLPAAGAGESWAFATGRVEVHLGPVVQTTLAENLDRSENVVTYRAERYAVAIWDGIDEDELAAAAVLVDWAS